MEGIASFRDFFDSKTYWFRYQFIKFFGSLLIFFMPLLFGKFFIDAYTKISVAPQKWAWSTWKPHWPVLVIGFVWFVGYLMSRYRSKHNTRSKELYNALKWICKDLCTRNDKSKDIRSTVWIPIGKLSKDHTIHLVQFCDYYPLTSTLPGGNEIRKNGSRFRTFTVSKKTPSGTLKPIGLLGYTALQCVGGDDYSVTKESFDSRLDFIDHMVNDWNFTPSQAKKINSRS